MGQGQDVWQWQMRLSQDLVHALCAGAGLDHQHWQQAAILGSQHL